MKKNVLVSSRIPISMSTVLLAALMISLIGCTKKLEKSQDIRPVRALTLGAEQIAIASEYSGEVKARVESRLGFRVGGKIIARKVDVGTMVKRGQILLQLDPQDLQL